MYTNTGICASPSRYSTGVADFGASLLWFDSVKIHNGISKKDYDRKHKKRGGSQNRITLYEGGNGNKKKTIHNVCFLYAGRRFIGRPEVVKIGFPPAVEKDLGVENIY